MTTQLRSEWNNNGHHWCAATNRSHYILVSLMTLEKCSHSLTNSPPSYCWLILPSVEHVNKSIAFTPYDTRWIPCSARFAAMGIQPNGKGALHIYQVLPWVTYDCLTLSSAFLLDSPSYRTSYSSLFLWSRLRNVFISFMNSRLFYFQIDFFSFPCLSWHAYHLVPLPRQLSKGGVETVTEGQTESGIKCGTFAASTIEDRHLATVLRIDILHVGCLEALAIPPTHLPIHFPG